MIKFQKCTFEDQAINLAVVYRSPSSSRINFVDYLVDIVDNIDIFLGDFNINSFHDTRLNNTALHIRFQMIITKPTHFDGGLIDHLYLGNSPTKSNQASSLIRYIYFSDHDAFKCKVYLNNSEDGIDFSIIEPTQE